jgi:hypothetical protein
VAGRGNRANANVLGAVAQEENDPGFGGHAQPCGDSVQYVDAAHSSRTADDLTHLGLAKSGSDTQMGLTDPCLPLDQPEYLRNVPCRQGVKHVVGLHTWVGTAKVIAKRGLTGGPPVGRSRCRYPSD